MSQTPTDFMNMLGEGQEDGQAEALHEYNVYVEPDRITFVKKSPGEETIIDDQPPRGKQASSYFSFVLSLLLLFSTLFIPSSAATLAVPFVTVTIVPKTATITTTQAIVLPARMLPALTLSESKTIPTTGKGHQLAQKARGYITFYNGLFQSQTIASGTILTSNDGVQIITDQLASIPAANPPGLGAVTVSAHALVAGVQGNISAYAINQLCCTTAVKAVNTTAFHGGVNERYFSTVSTQDVNKLSTQLRETLNHSMQGAFTAQLQTDEALIPPLCSETITPDHKPGAEATTVQVSVSETCSAGAYDRQSLQEQASQLLTTAVLEQLGAGYSLFGDIQYQLVQATMQQGKAIIEIACSGVWVYQLSQSQQYDLIKQIAGKNKQTAINTLLSVPGIQEVSMNGIAASAILPSDTTHIHLLLVYREE